MNFGNLDQDRQRVLVLWNVVDDNIPIIDTDNTRNILKYTRRLAERRIGSEIALACLIQ